MNSSVSLSDTVFLNLLNINHTDPVISATWLDTILDIMKYVSKEVLQSEGVLFVQSKISLCRSINERIIGCQILGGLINELDPIIVKRDVIPIIQSLCQDVSGQVRAAICHKLPLLYSVLGMEEAHNLNLLPSLIELTNDSDAKVCSESFDTVLNLIPFLSQDSIVTIILPLIKKFFNKCTTQTDLNVLLIVSKNAGKIFTSLEGKYSFADKEWILSQFVELPKLSLSDNDFDLENLRNENEGIKLNAQDILTKCRQHCAENLVQVAKFCLDCDIMNKLVDVLILLSQDSSMCVRMIIASNFLQVTHLFQKFSRTVLDIYLKLLGDVQDIRSVCIPILYSVFSQSTDLGIIRKNNSDATSLSCVEALVSLIENSVLSRKWRTTVKLLEEIQCSIKLLPAEFFDERTIHILFKNLKISRQVPCRLAFANTLLIIMKETANQESKDYIQRKIIQELCSSPSFYDRTIYVQLCPEILKLFHCPLVREQFLILLLNLADDEVVNIRISLCIIIPGLMKILKTDNDVKTISILERVIFALENERCRSISEQVLLMKKKLQDLSNSAEENSDDFSVDEKTNEILDINGNIKNTKSVIEDTSNHGCSKLKTDEVTAMSQEDNVKNLERTDDFSFIQPNQWTEKEFLMDAGVSMKSTETKIPLPNSKPGLFVLKIPKDGLVDHEKVHINTAKFKSSDNDVSSKKQKFPVKIKKRCNNNNIAKEPDLLGQTLQMESIPVKSVGKKTQRRKNFVYSKQNNSSFTYPQFANNNNYQAIQPMQYVALMNPRIENRFQNPLITHQNNAQYIGNHHTDNLCLSLQYMKIFQHSNPVRFNTVPQFQIQNRELHPQTLNERAGRSNPCIPHKMIPNTAQFFQHSSPSSDDHNSKSNVKQVSRLPVRHVRK